jgi:hypothetical protein
MVTANLKIIEELKAFLATVTKNKEFKKLITQHEDDFSRIRKLPIEHIIGIIINMPKRSLSIEIAEFFNSLGNGLKACTKGAFSLQRSKLQPLFFKAWNKWLVGCFYTCYGSKVKRWRNFLLQAVDGSTAYLLNKQEVKDYFGVQDNQHTSIPMARVMQIHDVLNNITVWGDIYPIKESEQSIMALEVERLAADSLTLFDRGYPGFTLLYRMLNEEMPRHFVMRCRTNFNKQTRQFARSSKRSKIVTFTPTAAAIAMLREHGYRVTKNTVIKIRMVRITLPTGENEILLTSLYDQKLYNTEDLKYLYSLRWGIETVYGKQKNQQQMEQFSGHRVICIKQDYLAGIFVANLQSLIEKQCENYLYNINKLRRHRYKINCNISWGFLKHNVFKLFLKQDIEMILLFLQRAFERNIEPVRPGRQYPRTLKTRRLNGKYQTFTNYKRAI